MSFDPNVRLPLWHDTEACRCTILAFIPTAHMVKLSDEELVFLTHIKDEQQAVHALLQEKVQVLFVTLGADGATLYTRQHCVKVSASLVKAMLRPYFPSPISTQEHRQKDTVPLLLIWQRMR
ncbi:PfkB family carbohydrate kinase [Solibacillus sp. R5-41]|uniref:PfkB family carbohydrate kinase n=1 Tax=Solibacillus sp. R5-41 TaxID=2048654 RepID=UPI00352D7E8B